MSWLSFANPLLLAGLVAVGLPVLIHFLTRARPRRIAFPPYRFLVEACAGQQAVHRLRTILLLTLRTLAILALVLLFTRPFLKPTGAAAESQAGERVVIVLDASLSMRAVQRGMPLFARAKSEAAEVLRGLDSGSEAAVVLAGSSARALLPALSRNLPALHDQLVSADATFENGDPAAALAFAARMLNGPGTIYVFSDFQKANWENAGELPAGIVCRLRPVTDGLVENVAITTARLSPEQPVIGEPAEVICTVFNCTPRPREERVRLDFGEVTREVRVAVPAFGSADAAFEVVFSRPGVFSGTVALDADDFPEDNTRYLAANVTKALQILLISDTDSGDPRSAAFYLSRALAPSVEAAPGLSLVRRHSQDADRGILETADLFVLVAPALLPGETVEVISRRLHEGARLMVFLDGPTAPMLTPAAFAPPFLLQRSITSPAGDRVIPGPRRMFSESDPGDLEGVRFFRRYETVIRAGHENGVVLSYADGSAAVAISAAGRGAAVFANLPLTPDGGNFAGSPMFPALLHELLREMRQESAERGVTPGAAWILDVPSGGGETLAMFDPRNRPVAVRVMASGRTTRLALPAAELPGLYVVRENENNVFSSAVNVDSRESDTRPLALENLKAGVGTAVTVAHGETDLLLSGRTRPLWPQLAAAAALFLALEMLLLALWRRSPVPAGSQSTHSSGAAMGGAVRGNPVSAEVVR